MQAQGFSLWLMPSGRVRDRLARVIAELSARYTTPAFEPHITLLSGLGAPQAGLIEKCASLSRLLEAFDIRLATVEALDEYFRSLFVRVEPAAVLEAANARAGEVFRVKESRSFLPHLSLLYGDLPAQEKRKLIAELGPLSGLTFRAGRFHLVSTEGEPAAWRHIRAYPLGS